MLKSYSQKYLQQTNFMKSYAKLSSNQQKCGFDNFIENIDYRTDSQKVYKFINKINKTKNVSTEPLYHNNEMLTDDKLIAEPFNKFYTSNPQNI